MVTLDEVYVYLSNCNNPCAIYYRPRGEKNVEKRMQENIFKEFYNHRGYCYNGKLTICRVANKAKINSLYYQDEVLITIHRTEIPALYEKETNKIWMHQDKASNNSSGLILIFLERMELETGIHAIPFSIIVVS